MAKPVEFNIYIGKTGTPQRPPKPFVIPEKWKPILALAYAYTTDSIYNTVIDLSNLQNAIDRHNSEINELSEDVVEIFGLLDNLQDNDLIDKINTIAGKINQIDPDLLKQFAYVYADARDELYLAYSYAYSYSLYETGLSYSYSYVSTERDKLQQNIYLLSNKIIDEYVTYSYANATYARKSDIPTNVSDLNQDIPYITHDALDDYITSNYVDERIENLINHAPTSLDTLKEIANALNNDPNLGTTLTNQISQKADLSYVQNEFDKMKAQKDDIPVYDESKIQEITDTGKLPDKYIKIPSPEQLYTDVTETDTYLSIIFSTLRKLQQEVSRLQRTFDKGIISMVNEQTRMSYINSEYADVHEEEPMWAVDPESLTEITGAEFFIDNGHTLEPTSNVIIETEKLVINETASWNDNREDDITGNATNYLHNNTDSKQYVYITANKPNVKVYLTNYETAENIIVDFTNLASWRENNKYNILLCVSRAITNNLNTYVGSNFIYVSVGDYYEGRTVTEGYFKGNKIRDTFAEGQLGTQTSGQLKNNRYYISRIEFTNLELYRMTFYSKFQDFANDVQPMVPDDDDTYSVAHITIRSVKNIEQLKKIKDQLLENELIYNDSNNCIYIIKDNEIKLISGGSHEDPSDDTSGMERNEIIKWLESNGIIGLTQTDDELFDKLSFNAVGDITFINQLNEKFKYTIDTDGNLKGSKVNETTFADMISKVPNLKIDENIQPNQFKNTRGFIGTYNEYKKGYKNADGITADNTYNYNKDMKLLADRIKIGNIYAPIPDSTVFGCTHGYIELENTSDQDYPLDGFYIHFARRVNINGESIVQEYSLPLSGVIYGGSTYLIRCKKYSDISQSNTFIDVNSFDIEWVTADTTDDDGNIIKGSLLDLTLGSQNTFLLTYGLPGRDRVPTIEKNGVTVQNPFDYKTVMMKQGSDVLPNDFVYHPCYVDSVSILANITSTDSSNQIVYSWCGWASNGGIFVNNYGGNTNNPAPYRDALYKTTFELDPAKQAFQSLHWNKADKSGKDSSRVRSNTNTDYQTVYLQKEYIEFPKSDERYPVSMYTPMASYLRKNVCTDKTKLDMNKPNMTTVAFGINMHTTRCFNWVSAGQFDEYVWLKKQSETEWNRFESYKTVSNTDTTYDTYKSTSHNTPFRKEFTRMTNNAAYARMHNTFPGIGIKYTAHKCIIEVDNDLTNRTTPVIWEYIVGRADKNGDPDPEHTTDTMTFTMYPSDYEPRLYQTTDQQGFHWIEYQTWAAAAKELNKFINSQITETQQNYQSWATDNYDDWVTAVNNHIEWENNENKENIEEPIIPNKPPRGIIPVILNTGDATQNGTRINEWLDYYIGGKCLFNHIEQMSIVGNNDLCDNDPTILGTGDDSGKSNGYYHHVFYCYEVDEKLTDDTYPTNDNAEEKLTNKEYKYLPLIKGTDNKIRFIPSFYVFGTPDKYSFVMMNSELTPTNCGKWFKKTIHEYDTDLNVNLYTGWTIKESAASKNAPVYDSSFTTIYTMLYNIITDHIANKKSKEPSYNYITQKANKTENLIVACHEMPFTVVTDANLKPNTVQVDRSISDGKLVGSHMNMMSPADSKSNYWFSRLLEHFGVKFCYGGHKHTYAITNELRENYLYTVDGVEKSSFVNGPMIMPQTLEGNNDTAVFITNIHSNGTQPDTPGKNIQYTNTGTELKVALSKFPLMNIDDDVACPIDTDNKKLKGINISESGDYIYPYYGVELSDDEDLGGVIYMMCQATGFKLKSNKELPGPKQRFSYIIPKTNTTSSGDKPNANQQHPMFTEIQPDTCTAYLMRYKNIHSGSNVLQQDVYATANIVMEYLYRKDSDTSEDSMYGVWTEDRTILLSW